MATSMILGQSDLTADSINAKSVISLEQTDGGFAVTKSALTCTITCDGDENTIRDAANTAKENCPISKVLNCDITLDLTVKS
jgi:osmotically inducible protein OsmC